MKIILAILKKFIRLFLKILYAFRVNNRRILFISQGGKVINCNPYYICKYIQSYYSFDFEYVWIVDSLDVKCDIDDVKLVKKNTFDMLKYYMTSKVIITNNTFPSYIPFRKKQFLINTWHGGGAYKRIACSLKKSSFIDRLYMKESCNYNNKHVSYILSSSLSFTKAMTDAFDVQDNRVFLPIGMPRNDVFFSKHSMDQSDQRVRQCYLLEKDVFIVLYAPTFRGDSRKPIFDFCLDIQGLESVVKKRFGVEKVLFMFRGHHTFANDLRFQHKSFLNVSDYTDMQDLLCAANMLISDFSSTIWDFSFTYKPCFLFVPDLDDYENTTSFYFPFEKWGFPYAKTNGNLQNLILNFNNEKFVNSMRHHHESLGSYETGNATRIISNKIVDICMPPQNIGLTHSNC